MEAPIASMIMSQQIEIVSLRQQLAECKKDAERYRWLRAADQTEVLKMSHYAFDALDAVIDAAMGETK